MEGVVPLAGQNGVYDHALLAILQNCVKLPNFLDAVFSFLARRTDFYVIMKHERAKMGFPPGVAESMVANAFKKYEILTRKRETEILKEEETRQAEAMTAPRVPPPVAAPQPEKPVKRKKKKEPKPVEPLDELPISVPGAPPVAPPPVESPEEEEEEEEEEEGPNNEPPKSDPTSTDGSEAVEPVILKPPAKDKPSDLVSDTYNGAVMENYKWSQTLTDVDVRVPLAPHTKPADVKVDIRNDYLRVELLKPERKVVIDKPLLHKVKVEESMWSIDKANNYLTINLEKTKEIMWKSVLEGEEGIDLSKVDTTRDISEFDPECQAAIQRVSYDHHMKMLGKPTSQQSKAHDILKKAWNAPGSPFKGTPFDPSRVQISGQW